ncbi:MAG: hypothetical protein WC849_01040 [Candidatus Paceibacterota bacterium]
MKKLTLLLLLVIVLSVQNFGQELTKYFAGVLYTGSYDQNLNVLHGANLRLAGQFEVSNFVFRGVYTSENKNLFLAWWDAQIENTTVQVGFMGRPIAFLNRPSPVSAGAQFEPGGLSVIPGSAIGGLLTQKISDTKVYGGVYYLPNEKLPEYNIGFSNDVSSVGYFFSEKSFGVAGTIKIPDLLTLTGYIESLKTTSGFLEVVLGGLGAPYVSVVYDRNKKVYDSQVGWTKKWKVKEKENVYVLLGLGYLPEAKVLNVYFWVHL